MPMKNRVREARQAAQLTQEALAMKVGVTRQSIIAIEQGKYGPSVKLALELAAALGVRVEDLFELGGRPERGTR
jgi:putative transcriptional regulator